MKRNAWLVNVPAMRIKNIPIVRNVQNVGMLTKQTIAAIADARNSHPLT